MKTTKAVLAIAIGFGLTLGAAAQPGKHPGEKVDLKSLPASVQQTITEKADRSLRYSGKTILMVSGIRGVRQGER